MNSGDAHEVNLINFAESSQGFQWNQTITHEKFRDQIPSRLR
ncbi:hypothetical protein SAMN04489723_104290 [Algoriphagus aquimarinus]|uniref:Uncharacterized protein n=1 Tax=Algoriphagus aquimarinus TaxID=237018 RepID=A0A1I0YGW9_9BACT|nr:hypothetical protein SAMN04489723_104290 [Algoriphagus aquimarinus]